MGPLIPPPKVAQIGVTTTIHFLMVDVEKSDTLSLN